MNHFVIKIKTFIKYLILLLKFKLERVSLETYNLEKLKFIANPSTKKKVLKKLLADYPDSPFVQWEIYNNALNDTTNENLQSLLT